MILAAAFAFFLIVFLVASILTAVAYLVFLRLRAEESASSRERVSISGPAAAAAENQRERTGEQGLTPALSPLLQTDRLSTITFWDSILERIDFAGILKARMEQADLNWSVDASPV